jgi:hypothetical protein
MREEEIALARDDLAHRANPEWLVTDRVLFVLLTQLAADSTLFTVSSEV